MPALKSIVLGSNALSYVRSFSTANMTALETLVMGNEAFKLGDALYVTNVPRLRTLEMGSAASATPPSSRWVVRVSKRGDS